MEKKHVHEHEHEQRPAVEEYAETIADLVAYERGGERHKVDRRLEALDWAIAQAAEAIRDYLVALEEWDMTYNVQQAIGTLDRDGDPISPPHVRDEMATAAARQQEAGARVAELKEKMKPVITRIVRLHRIREDLQAKLKEA